MVEDEKLPDEPFLQRWARRKTEAATTPPEETAPQIATAETATAGTVSAVPPETESEAEATGIDLASLPDIDSLDESSDFSVFMQNGIPEALQRRALQKLWRLDPAFGHIDGLLEYGEDFAGSGLAAEAVNTLYKVGKGMVSDEAEAEEDDAATATEANAAKDTGPAEPESSDPSRPAESDPEARPITTGTRSDAGRTG